MSVRSHASALEHLPTLANRPNSQALDLVFILDTICSEDALNERRRFIRNVIQEVADDLPTEGNLRVGVIPYGPHENLVSDSQPDSIQIPISLAPLTENLSSVLRFLRGQAAQLSKGFEGAYEEALYVLHNLEWRPTSHRILVTVGHRPPRPSKPWLLRSKDPFDCFFQESCEQHLDWRFLLTGMRSALRIHSIAVVCKNTWLIYTTLKYAEKYANHCWKEVGYTMSLKFSPTPAAARQLAHDILKMV